MSFLDTLFNNNPAVQSPTAGGTLPDSIYQQMLGAAPESVVPRQGGGVGGLLRHVAGTLANTFMQMKYPEVAKEQKSERDAKQIGQILQGYDADPMGTINKIASVDAPLAQRYYEHYQNHLDKQDLYKIYGQRADNTAAKVDDAKTNFVMQRVANMLGAKGVTADNYSKVRDVAKAYASGKGVTNLPFDIPDTYDPDEIAAISNYGLNLKDQNTDAYRQTRIGQFDRDLGIQQQVANSRSTDSSTRQADHAERVRSDIAKEGQAATNESGRNTRTEEVIAGANARTNHGRGLVKPHGGTDKGSPPPTPGSTPNQVLRNKVTGAVWTWDGHKWN